MPLIVGASVLDVGCGYGRWCHLISSNFWEAGLYEPPAVDGFDAFAENVAYCRRHGCYRNVWEQRLPSALEGTWDTVLACEVIEHVQQAEVLQVVETLERAAQKRIIFTTPNSPMFRGGLGTTVGFNEFEAHLAYVPQRFFRERGYRILGAGFGKEHSFLARAANRLKLRPALHSVPLLLPRLSTTTVAVKDVIGATA